MANKVTSPHIDIESKGPLIDDAFNIHLNGFTACATTDLESLDAR